MLTYVKRTTIKVPDDVDRAMRDEAQRREMTLSEWAREAIEAHLAESHHPEAHHPRQSGKRRLLATGAGSSGRSDVAQRASEILAAELGTSR